MPLQQKIQQDMIAAMKNGDQLTTSTLRMLKAAIMKFEVSGKEKKEATDEESIQIVGKEIKSRKDSVEQFQKGGRDELAAKEEAEIKVLQKYLPAQMTEEELRKMINEIVNQVGAHSKADLGKVMGALMPRVKGKADGAMVNRIVQEMLN